MSTDLVDLIEKVASDPAELMHFKQDPKAYLEQAYITLSSDEKTILLGSNNPVEETATVFTITTAGQAAGSVASLTDTATTDNRSSNCSISLENTSVLVKANNPEGLVIESTGGETYYCFLLSDSYITYDCNNQLAVLELSISYTDQRYSAAATVTFQIQTTTVSLPHCSGTYYFNNSPATFSARQSLILPGNFVPPTSVMLQQGSSFDSSTNALTLIFHHQYPYSSSLGSTQQ